MIYLVHGEDVVSSKNFVFKKGQDYESLDQVSLKNEENILTALPTGNGLFSSKRLLVIENFPLKKKWEIPKNIDYDILLWFEDTITPPAWVDKVWYFKARDTNSVFRFVDYIFSGKEKQALLTLKDLLLLYREREMLIGTLVRQVRMIALNLNGEKSEVSKSPFVQSKIQEQAKNWNKKKIRIALMYLLKTDLWMKQGKLSPETLLTNLTVELCRLGQG